MEYSDKNGQIIEMNDEVDVDKTDDNNDFRGHVVDYQNEFVVVEDQNGDCFSLLGIEIEVVN